MHCSSIFKGITGICDSVLFCAMYNHLQNIDIFYQIARTLVSCTLSYVFVHWHSNVDCLHNNLHTDIKIPFRKILCHDLEWPKQILNYLNTFDMKNLKIQLKIAYRFIFFKRYIIKINSFLTHFYCKVYFVSNTNEE